MGPCYGPPWFYGSLFGTWYIGGMYVCIEVKIRGPSEGLMGKTLESKAGTRPEAVP